MCFDNPVKEINIYAPNVCHTFKHAVIVSNFMYYSLQKTSFMLSTSSILWQVLILGF